MSKEVLLKKSYDAATVNDVVRRGDDEISFEIVKNGMMDYAKKNRIAVSSEEVESYIRSQFQALKDSTSDYSFQSKMMN